MNEKTVLATVAGVANPILKNWAQQLASFVPAESAIRHDAFGSVIGALNAFIETQADKLSPVAGVALKRGIDLYEMFSGALASQINFEKWAGEILNEAGPRLKAATDPAAEMERIQLEFKLRKQLVEIIRQESPTSRPAINWQEVDKQAAATLTGINEKLESWLPQVKAWAEGSKKIKEAGHG